MVSRLVLFTAASGLLLGLSPHLAPTLTPLCLIITGFLVTLLVVRRISADAMLSWFIGISYVLKVVLALALFYISQWGLPALETIQLGNGFWTFGRDAAEYHRLGQQIVEAWRLGIALPEMGGERGMKLYCAAVYFLFGSSPLHPVLLNAWYGTLSVVFAVLLVRRFTDDPWAARIAALLIAFWPSLLLWSTQLLKESFAIFLVLAELYLIVTFWKPPQDSSIRGAGRWIAAFCISFLIQFIRDYLGIIFAVSVVLAFYPATILGVWRGEFRLAGRAVAISLVIIVTTVFAANHTNLIALASLVQPGREYLQPPGSIFLKDPSSGIISRATPEYLGKVRQGIIGEGGGSVVDRDVKVNNVVDMLWYLPRGLTVVFFAPFPWQWFSTNGDAGPLRLLVGLETLIFYLLLPSVILCVRSLWRHGDPKGWFLLAFIGLLVVAFAIAIPNVGTLFRLRLQFIIPLVILLASTRSLSGVYGRIFERSRLVFMRQRMPSPSD